MPAAGERFGDHHKPFLCLSRAGTFLRSAWPVARQFASVGARTGRARQNCFAHATGDASGMPLARSLRRGKGLRLASLPSTLRRKGCDNHKPFLWPCGEWPRTCFAIGQVRSRFAGRASCAPLRQSQCCAHGKALPQTRAVAGTADEREELRPILSRRVACERWEPRTSPFPVKGDAGSGGKVW